MKSPRLRKEAQNKEDDIKKYIKYYQYWNDWIFQSHCNKMEWLVPKNCDVKKNPFCKSYYKFYIKDKTNTNYWVGHSLMKPIDVY